MRNVYLYSFQFYYKKNKTLKKSAEKKKKERERDSEEGKDSALAPSMSESGKAGRRGNPPIILSPLTYIFL
jgi:hypothetical protein